MTGNGRMSRAGQALAFFARGALLGAVILMVLTIGQLRATVEILQHRIDLCQRAR